MEKQIKDKIFNISYLLANFSAIFKECFYIITMFKTSCLKENRLTNLK